jgi:cytochrome P450
MSSTPASNLKPTALDSSAVRAGAPTARIAPGPRGPISALALMRAPLPYLEKMFRQYGDVVHLRMLNLHVYAIAHPDGIRHALQDNHRNYTKSADYQILARLLGNGLVTSEGALWLRQRRLMQPMFHRQKIAAFGAMMTECTGEMLERWSGRAQSGEAFDVVSEMMRLTLHIVGRALLTMDLTSHADQVGRNMTIANESLSEFNLSTLMPWLPSPRNLRFKRATRELRSLVLNIIADRRRDARDYGDLLSMLLAARDEETGEAMSDEQLRDEVLTLILAGHETTATALSWTWYLISQHPQVERKLRAELDEVLGGRPPAMADLVNLNYTGMVIDEAMRLYPPVWAIGRAAIEDDEIMGYRVPRGSNVMLSQWMTHRHPKFWENPERFEPERFSAEQAAGRPRYAYFPFSGGPRQCIGNIFALTEANLILAAVAQKYSPRLVPGHRIEPYPLITLRPRYGLKMTLE